MAKELSIGDKAPAFTLPIDGDKNISLAQFAGKPIVLYFYPKDDTSGCTREAIDFTAAAKAFAKLNCVVIGCSRDTVAQHDKFKAKHALAVTLVSDVEGKLCEAYGVWVEKSMYGRKYMGIERATYLIDDKGRINHIWRKVKVPGHVAEVLNSVSSL